VLAGEVGDQVRGRVDRAAIDRLHGPTIAAVGDTSPVSARGTLRT
jgi:hypothetical protein